MQYDVIVAGAGVAGCSAAWHLSREGLRVLLIDRSGLIARGGSGAAGAFVSPKIGKGSPLQSLTNEAFAFAVDFYRSHFPSVFHTTGVVRIPKDAEDAEKFGEYARHIGEEYRLVGSNELQSMGINGYESFLFESAGVCDAREACEVMAEEIDFAACDLKELVREDGLWKVGEYSAPRLVLATGHDAGLCDLRYMGIRGTWGSRGDYRTSLPMPVSMHQNISVSANMGGIIKIGATHNKSRTPCLECHGRPLDALFGKASGMVDTGDFVLEQVFCGMRSGSKDYFPLVGGIIDVARVFELYPKITIGARIKEPLPRIEELYIINGLGGRGFVLGPMMGRMLARHIVHGEAVDSRVDPDRLFLKWCRKGAKE